MYLYFYASYIDEFFVFFYVFWIRESIPASHKFMTFTDDFETQSHVILYVTFTNFSCICPITMKFLLFLMFIGLEKSIPTIQKCVTFMDDLETQGHVT